MVAGSNPARGANHTSHNLNFGDFRQSACVCKSIVAGDSAMDEGQATAAFQDLQARLSRTSLRFAACGPKGHSASWTAFGQGNDYYIGSRNLMGSQKISLHASRICRVALTQQHYNSLPAQGLLQPLDRAIVKWRRPETPETGAVHVASVIFPSDHMVQSQPTGSYRKPLIIFGDAPLGKAFDFGFFFSREDSKALEDRFLRIGQPLCSTKLADGTTVSLVSRLIDFDPSVLPNQQQMDGTAGRILSPEIKRLNDGEEVSGLTAMFWNAPKDGESLTLYEIGGVSLRRNPVPR
jgi:hypothetical protein